jgi:hypothetical protein
MFINMIVSMNKKTISNFLEQEEIIEFTILPLHNNEFLIDIETPNKKNISMITDNWEELIKEFY